MKRTLQRLWSKPKRLAEEEWQLRTPSQTFFFFFQQHGLLARLLRLLTAYRFRATAMECTEREPDNYPQRSVLGLYIHSTLSVVEGFKVMKYSVCRSHSRKLTETAGHHQLPMHRTPEHLCKFAHSHCNSFRGGVFNLIFYYKIN